MANAAVNKGKRGEKEVIAILNPVIIRVFGADGESFGQRLERNYDKSRNGSHDIIGTGLEEIALEVKRHENPNVPAFWRQAVDQGVKTGKHPVLWWRKNRGPWTVRTTMQVWLPSFTVDQWWETNQVNWLEWFELWLEGRKDYYSLAKGTDKPL